MIEIECSISYPRAEHNECAGYVALQNEVEQVSLEYELDLKVREWSGWELEGVVQQLVPYDPELGQFLVGGHVHTGISRVPLQVEIFGGVPVALN